MSSMTPPEKPDTKNIPLESGKGLPEGDPKIETIRYYKVFCPKCRAFPGQPCKFRGIVDYYSIHIPRIILFEAFELGSVDANGMGRNGKPNWGKE